MNILGTVNLILLYGSSVQFSIDKTYLFMLLKDRHELSVKNNWIDKEGNIFFLYTRKDMMDMLNLNKNTITKNIINKTIKNVSTSYQII